MFRRVEQNYRSCRYIFRVKNRVKIVTLDTGNTGNAFDFRVESPEQAQCAAEERAVCKSTGLYLLRSI